MEAVDREEIAAARQQYVARHAQAADYFEMADFHLYVLRAAEARFSGGFGDMGWVGGDDLRALLAG
jgi:putative heme iron utilization protein